MVKVTKTVLPVLCVCMHSRYKWFRLMSPACLHHIVAWTQWDPMQIPHAYSTVKADWSQSGYHGYRQAEKTVVMRGSY